MMGKSERQASDGEEQERHATDGGVQEAVESKRQACGGVEQETGEWWGRAGETRN